MRPNRSCLACALVLVACAGETAAGGAASALEPSRTVEGEGTRREDVEPAPLAVVPATVVGEGLIAIHGSAEPGLAEDGEGHVVQASAPVLVDLDGHVFPPRALDPILTIGQRRFTHYSHPAVGVLRFTLSDPSLLVPGQDLSIHYARDASDVRVVHTLVEADVLAAGQP